MGSKGAKFASKLSLIRQATNTRKKSLHERIAEIELDEFDSSLGDLLSLHEKGQNKEALAKIAELEVASSEVIDILDEIFDDVSPCNQG